MISIKKKISANVAEILENINPAANINVSTEKGIIKEGDFNVFFKNSL